MLKVGLTGGIGSGKTRVSELFAELGIPIIDTDLISRDLTARDGAALPAIREAWGDSVMQADGELDRAALRRKVFSDAAARRRLESILHPLIRQGVIDALTTISAPYVLIVIPLLVETGQYRELLDRVLVVDCPEALQVERTMTRSGLSADEVSAILAAQVDRATRLAAADDVVVNDAGIDALREQVARLDLKYRGLTHAPA